MISFVERVTCTRGERYARAMRALQQGVASESQQLIALGWIINVACRVEETTFVPGDSHASAFLEGRRSIAQEIVALIKSKPIKEAENDGSSGDASGDAG